MIKNTIGEDGCPCGEYYDGETYIKSHCWRTSYNDCKCKYAGIHYKGELKTAKKIVDMIEERYNCDVNIIELKKYEALSISTK